MTPSRRSAAGAGLAVAGLAAAVGALACRARTDEFYAAIWPCDINASDACGTTRTGRPMTCFAASQLGGTDFCTEACDGGAGDPNSFCTTSGALLQTCTPSADGGTGDGCPDGLSCYRTDLVLDQGLCIKMPVCSQDTDCPDHRYQTCASTLVKQRTSLPLHVDHLQCLVSMCGAGKTDCPLGQGCLAGYYEGATASEYDVCVSTCDGNTQCPPNFACAKSPVSSGSPSLCLPGVPGMRCYEDQDCAAGDCVDTGAGFKECVLTILSCETDLDCAVLDGTSSTFLCVEGVPGAGKHCILAEEFHGWNCEDTTTDCPAGMFCAHYSPYEPSMSHGECRVPCGADLGCPLRGGIPHVCLAGGAGGCYPTTFGLPCTGAADCRPELMCLPVLPDEHTVIDSPMICTQPCTTDADCTSNPLIRSFVFCREDEHLCRMAGYSGAPCQADHECASGTCTGATSGAGTCA